MAVERLVVAHLIEPTDVGVTFAAWPLHITLLPWFRTEEVWAEEVFRRCAADLRACRVVLGARQLGPVALFGEAEDIPVRPIGDSTALGVAHGVLLSNLHPFLDDKTFIGGSYNPHVTIRNNPDPGEGAQIDIATLSMIRHDGEHKTVVETVKLQYEAAA